MAIISDAELFELYDGNRSELFPALRREGTLTPLVVLLAVLPPLIAMVNDRTDSADARWGLESLELISPSAVTGAGVEETGSWSSAEQKPLAAVLTGMTLQIPSLSPSIALSLAPFVCIIAVVMFWHSLCRACFGSRFAFWSTALIACHGAFLLQVQSAVPTLLGLVLALGTLTGLYAHISEAEGIVSGRLLFAGISLGLCLLTSGLAAAIVGVVALLFVIVMRFGVGKSSVSSSDSRSNHRGRWSAIGSVLVLFLTAFAVGGWWVMMSAADRGTEFWGIWLNIERPPELAVERSAEVSLIAFLWFRLVDLLGMLLVPSCFGIVSLGRELWQRRDDRQRIPMQFLASWLGGSAIIWFLWAGRRPGPLGVPDMLLMLPMVGAAAFAIEQIAVRRYRPLLAAWLVCLSFIIPLWTNAARGILPSGIFQGEWATLLSIAGYLVAFAILTVWLLTHASRHDDRQRYCLIVLLLVLVVSNAIQGLQSVRSSSEDRRLRLVLTQFYKSLLQHPGADAQILVTDSSAPPDVEFIVRMARPKLSLESIPNWNNGITRAAELMSETNRTVLIVDWRIIDGRITKPLEDKLDIKSQFKPTMIHGRRLSAIRLTRRIQPM